MRYTYAYKTSDGVRREDSMEAASREAVFKSLRRQGIRPIKVVAADGSKANGAPAPMHAVHRTAFLLVVLALIGTGAWLAGWRVHAPPDAQERVAPASSPRHQIYGDPATMESLERGDFAAILPRVGDRMLAVFAQPGKLMCARGADPRRLDAAQYAAFEAYANGELSPSGDIALNADEARELCELKQIVNGMREEMREYLANGNGTPRSYWRRLNERTLQEVQIYERTRRELEKETSEEVWEQKNDALRRLGLRTIPNPIE